MGFGKTQWLLVTRGENYPLKPAAANPVSIVRTIYAEADGIRLKEGAAVEAGTWLTMQRVDEVGDNSRRFTTLKTAVGTSRVVPVSRRPSGSCHRWPCCFCLRFSLRPALESSVAVQLRGFFLVGWLTVGCCGFGV